MCAKNVLRNNFKKTVIMNVKWTRNPNLPACKNPLTHLQVV